MSNTMLFQYIGKNLNKGKDLGIEVEVEFEGRVNYENWNNSDNYTLQNDGSLRNGVEFVSRGIQSVKDIKTTIDDIWDTFNQAKVLRSPRTSSHVHVSCLGLDCTQLLNFISLAWYFEDFIGNGCLPYRKDNNFCIKISDAEDPVFYIVDNFRKNSTFFDIRFRRETFKYSATNFSRLNDLGSLEFRQFHVPEDREDLKKWCENLVAIRTHAEQYKDPTDLFLFLSSNKFSTVAKKILPFPLVHGEPKDYDKADNNMFLISKLIDNFDIDKNYWSSTKKKEKQDWSRSTTSRTTARYEFNVPFGARNISETTEEPTQRPRQPRQGIDNTTIPPESYPARVHSLKDNLIARGNLLDQRGQYNLMYNRNAQRLQFTWWDRHQGEVRNCNFELVLTPDFNPEEWDNED